MEIAINADAAFKQPRTGVEEYTYQLIRHLAMLKEAQKHRFILYHQGGDKNQVFPESRNWPDNFIFKKLGWPLPAWTQIRFAGELLQSRPENLFIPVHVLPLFSPKKSVVTLHGLEYEYYPKLYPAKDFYYLRFSTKYALSHAKKIITISENSKKDLINLYNGDPDKIEVIYHGFDRDFIKTNNIKKEDLGSPYFLYLGRLENKKNISNLIKAFDLFKNNYKTKHKLILAGEPGYGYGEIKFQINQSKDKKDIVQNGYVSETKKWQLFLGAEGFLFPSYYEGFGMPILEAQSVGCPVVASNTSSIPEVGGEGAVYHDPDRVEEISESMYKVIEKNNFRDGLIKKGHENLERFSWRSCALKTLNVFESLN